MENRKSLRLFVFISVFIFTLGASPSALAYGVDTHAYLTDEVIGFYNSNYSSNPIEDEWKSYLIDGSRREDDVPRWMNHFYDPVNNRGLDDPEWGKGFSSKEWAQSDSKQITYAYRPIKYMASILSSVEQEEISGMDLNFTWQQAIRYYRDGEKEKAMFTLGHVLHLIEDASVPDHTRNDGHPEPFGDGSPYETFTERFTLSSPDKDLRSRLSNRKPFDSMPTLSGYFNEIAKYSNNNFYSKDTINKIYNLPTSVDSKIVGNTLFSLGSDGDGLYKISAQPAAQSNLEDTSVNITIGNDLVLSDYWSRLSTKSVQVGAGVIKLFFDDIERVNYGDARLIKDDRNPLTKLVDNARAWAQITFSFGKALTSSTSNITREAWSNTFSNGGSDEKLVEVIYLSENQPSNKPLNLAVNQQQNKPSQITQVEEQETEEQKIQQSEQQNQQIKTETKQEQIQQTQKQTPQTTATINFKECSFNTSKSPSREKVIINEVAWMGGSSDFGLTSTDEWIELKNISGAEVDVSGWQLIDKAEQIKINFSLIKNTKIKAGQFILLERTDDDSVPNVPADLIYSNTLNNSDEGLRLFDSQCNLIDEVLASPDWPAGDNTQKRTMERSPNGSTSLTTGLSWHTYNGTTQNNIFGTPKKENSTPVVVYGGGGSGAPTNNQQLTTGNQQQSSTAKILISEVQITGGTGKTENDFVELYNPNNFQVNLNGYRLVKRTKTGTGDTSIKSWTSDAYIPANSYYLWANSGYTDISATPDITTTATISNDNGVAVRFGSADTGTVIDSIAWGEAQNVFVENSVFPINPTANQSIQRKFQNNTFVDTNNNANDFEIQSCSSPKAQSRTCESASVNQTPSALLSLEIIEVIYNPEGSDDGNEVITISNPNSTEVDLSIYSVQYLGSSGDFVDIKKKNFEADSKIPGQGIFKIGVNCHGDTPCDGVQLSWSQALNNTSGTVFLMSNQELLSGISDSDIMDAFHYPEVTEVTMPENFTVDYDQNKLEMVFSWNGNPSLIYQIQEYNSPGVTVFEGKGGSFNKRVDEVGRNYKYSIRAFNENAQNSELVEKEISVPSFIENVRFYNASHYTYYGEEQEDLIEISYDSYPFLPLDLVYAPWGNPDIGPNYKLLVFYLNTEAPKRIYLNGASPLTEDINNVLRVKYETCASSNSPYASLLLPDTVEKCNMGSGFGSSSMSYGRYLTEGDKNLLLPADGDLIGQAIFTESDYITLAFYGFQRDFPQGSAPMDGIYPNFRLLAVDNAKYYFQSNTPIHSIPQLTGEITLNFDKQNSKLNVSWPSATDMDTLDALLTYEIKYTSSADWQPVGSTSVTKIVSAGDNFFVSVRAKDDFGNYSAQDLTADWSYPAVDFTFVQNENNTWSSSFGLGYGYYGSDGNGINLQSITPTDAVQFDKVSLRIKQLLASDVANLKLSVYSDKNGQPDFGLAMASSVISNIYNPDSNSDLTFHFINPVSFPANSKYWLALEVESYSDSRGFWRNEWQNAVEGTNPYLQGEAARVKVKITDGVYSYSALTVEPDNDWYIKIGLEL